MLSVILRVPLLRLARIIGAGLLAAAVLGGCSVLRLTYGQAPELAYWWLDGYVDIQDSQAARVRESVAAWFRWHRATQLPEYAAQLARLRRELAEPVTPAQACRWWGEVRGHMDTAFERAVPSMAEFVVSMSPQQLKHLEQRYAKAITEARRDFLQADREERRRASVKRVVERAESLYGRLDDEQRLRVADLAAQSPFDPERWIAERAQIHQEIVAALSRVIAGRGTPDEAQAVLRSLAARVKQSPRPAHREYQQRLVEHNCAFAARIHNLTTPEQRLHAQNKLAGWEADLRVIAGNGGAASPAPGSL